MIVEFLTLLHPPPLPLPTLIRMQHYLVEGVRFANAHRKREAIAARQLTSDPLLDLLKGMEQTLETTDLLQDPIKDG